MSVAAIRGVLSDPDRAGSLADRTRRQRRARLLAAFPDLQAMCVLDLGGTAGFWRHLGLYPQDLTLLNVTHHADPPTGRALIGDACDPCSEALDRPYDLVMCNSVIDQVGGLEQRKRLASVITQTAPRYWVQTANRAFVFDAYFLFPGFPYLPVPARTWVLRHWRMTHMHTRDPVEAEARVRSIELQGRRDMRALFPDARVVTERFCGLPKSLIAVRGGPHLT